MPKLVYTLCFFTLSFSYSYAQNNQISRSAYIEKYKPVCDSLETIYGIPPLVILGIAMYESNFGNSKVARKLKNHHGLAGKNTALRDFGFKTRYRQFNDDNESFTAFCEYVKKRKYYESMKETADLSLWLQTIGRHGYCQNPAIWKKHIIQLLKKENLYPEKRD